MQLNFGGSFEVCAANDALPTFTAFVTSGDGAVGGTKNAGEGGGTSAGPNGGSTPGINGDERLKKGAAPPANGEGGTIGGTERLAVGGINGMSGTPIGSPGARFGNGAVG
mmetsp:Transcript_78271/g.91425  ORF Transcript_78271/g.91425 Transcript_78271/m.91425 type:complete len:110 (-) Transcript_78271:256-585(-)